MAEAIKIPRTALERLSAGVAEVVKAANTAATSKGPIVKKM